MYTVSLYFVELNLLSSPIIKQSGPSGIQTSTAKYPQQMAGLTPSTHTQIPGTQTKITTSMTLSTERSDASTTNSAVPMINTAPGAHSVLLENITPTVLPVSNVSATIPVPTMESVVADPNSNNTQPLAGNNVTTVQRQSQEGTSVADSIPKPVVPLSSEISQVAKQPLLGPLPGTRVSVGPLPGNLTYIGSVPTTDTTVKSGSISFLPIGNMPPTIPSLGSLPELHPISSIVPLVSQNPQEGDASNKGLDPSDEVKQNDDSLGASSSLVEKDPQSLATLGINFPSTSYAPLKKDSITDNSSQLTPGQPVSKSDLSDEKTGKSNPEKPSTKLCTAEILRRLVQKNKANSFQREGNFESYRSTQSRNSSRSNSNPSSRSSSRSTSPAPQKSDDVRQTSTSTKTEMSPNTKANRKVALSIKAQQEQDDRLKKVRQNLMKLKKKRNQGIFSATGN